MATHFHPLARCRMTTLCAGLLLGCASAGGGSGGYAATVLTGDEIRETRAANVWDALMQLRPQWLRARGTSSLIDQTSNEAVVFVQGVPYGEVTSLQSMNVDQVRRVEFINARDATTRYGTNHAGGIIWVDLDR